MSFINHIKQIEIEVTNLCNSNCVFCPREKLTRERGIMSFQLFKKIINDLKEFKNLYKIRLSGFGEPLLDSGLFEKIKYAKENLNCLVQFTSNAILLSEEKSKKLIDSGLDLIAVSLYATNSERYKSVHRIDMFEKVKNNLINLVNLKKKLGKNKPLLEMGMINIPGGGEKRKKWIEFWSKHADKILFETGDMMNMTDGREYKKVRRDLPRLSCLRPFNMTNIYWNGDVSICCIDYNGKLVYGNVKDKTLREILDSSEYQKAVYYHKIRQFGKLPTCYNCDLLPIATLRNRIARFIFLNIKRRFGAG